MSVAEAFVGPVKRKEPGQERATLYFCAAQFLPTELLNSLVARANNVHETTKETEIWAQMGILNSKVKIGMAIGSRDDRSQSPSADIKRSIDSQTKRLMAETFRYVENRLEALSEKAGAVLGNLTITLRVSPTRSNGDSWHEDESDELGRASRVLLVSLSEPVVHTRFAPTEQLACESYGDEGVTCPSNHVGSCVYFSAAACHRAPTAAARNGAVRRVLMAQFTFTDGWGGNVVPNRRRELEALHDMFNTPLA